MEDHLSRLQHSNVEEEFYTDERAQKEGQHQAKVEFLKKLWLTIYHHNPDLIKGAMELFLRAENLKLKENSYSWAVTVSPGNYQNLERLKKDFLLPFMTSLERKYSIEDFVFITERASEGRLHLHGYITLKKSKRKRTYPSTVQALVWNSVPQPFLVENPKFNHKHIHVTPIYDKAGWDQYCSKTLVSGKDTFFIAKDDMLNKIPKPKSKI